MQAIPALFLLDPVFASDLGNKVIPMWGSLGTADQQAVKSLLKRLALANEKQKVVDELMQYCSHGYIC